MFTCVPSGVQDLALFQHKRKQWSQLLNFLLPGIYYEYVTRTDTQITQKFALNFIAIQTANETVNYYQK